MRTAINLSSQPFTNHRLLWLGVIAVSLLSVLTMLWISGERARISNEIVQTKKHIEDQKVAFQQAQEERERKEKEAHAVVINDQQAFELAAARVLIRKRQLSWSRILADLEKYVPEKARISGIKVDEIMGANRALIARIELKAIGASAGELTEFMESLGKSNGLFEVGEVTQETATDTNEVPFTVHLTYQPERGESQ